MTWTTRFFHWLLVCLLAGPLTPPGWGHARVESSARARAQVLEEWQGVMAENPVSGSFDLKVRYTYGQDLVKQDRVTSPVATDTADYYGYDGLGSVRVLIQGSGQSWAFGDTYVYDAFGIQLNTPGSTPNNYRYTGEQWDPDLGLYYLRARYYNPADGRFLTMDIFEGNNSDPLSLHKYLYCHDNPVNGTDPSGHNFISTLSAAALQFGLQTVNLAVRAGPALGVRSGMLVLRIQQHLWKLDVALAGLGAGAVLTEAGLTWVENTARQAMANQQAELGINGGHIFESIAGAAATDYQTIDHLIREPNGKVSVVSLGTRSDTPQMSDDVFLRKLESTLREKAQKISTERIFEARPGSSSPDIHPGQVAGRIAVVGIAETRAHLMSDLRMTQMLSRLTQTIPKVRSVVIPINAWRPGR